MYFQYRNLLTRSQWKLLLSIAKNGTIKQPTGKDFIEKYRLGNASSVRRSLLSLVAKEMVIEDTTLDEKEYSVYDCFLSRWLESI